MVSARAWEPMCSPSASSAIDPNAMPPTISATMVIAVMTTTLAVRDSAERRRCRPKRWSCRHGAREWVSCECMVAMLAAGASRRNPGILPDPRQQRGLETRASGAGPSGLPHRPKAGILRVRSQRKRKKNMSENAQPCRAKQRSFAALHHPGCRIYLLGTMLAMMADNIEHVISYWMIFQKFHSPALAGFAVVSHWAPSCSFRSGPVPLPTGSIPGASSSSAWRCS